MKRLTYMGLMIFLCATFSVTFLGCGCDDDDDDNGKKDAGAENDAADTPEEDGGETPEEDGGETTEEDASEPVVYACGGENAECDLLDENSCDEGDGCQFLIDVSGEGEPYAQCASAGDEVDGACDDEDVLCAPGYECYEGRCYKYCCELNSLDQCPEDQMCLIQKTNADGDATDVGLCDECDGCNPVTSEECGDDEGCYPIPDENGDATDCSLCLPSEEDLKLGEACDTANSCVPGLGCYSIDEEGSEEESDPVCVKFCDLEATDNPCEDDEICEDILEAASMGGKVGLCTTDDSTTEE